MLQLNLANVIKNKGYSHPNAFLIELGFSSTMASRILNNKRKSIFSADLERICVALNCTPNDLFIYMPPPRAGIEGTHALMSLRHEKNETSIMESLRELPNEKVKELQQIVSTMKKELKK